MTRIEVFESISLIIFILISLAFIKPPEWLKRALTSLRAVVDRWI